MKPRPEAPTEPGSWRSRILLLATAALVLWLAPSAQATTNVVPNPGFEQGGCGDTPVICDWVKTTGSSESDFMSQDTNAHSGNFAMLLNCGPLGCSSNGVSAQTDDCPAIGPGTHPASFWFSAVGWVWGRLDATFYSGPGCTGERLGWDHFDGLPAGQGWQQEKGTLLAPSGTQSARFEVVAFEPECDGYQCFPEASFDDLDVEAETTPDTTPPETMITSGPSGTTNSASATFEFSANETSTFECSLDGDAFATCASPQSYTGLGDGSHSFRVQATDAAGNTDPTPAERTWTVAPNITLTASGYKEKGVRKVDLMWEESGAASFDVYRDDNVNPIATVPPPEYTDNLGRGGSGTYRYKVCEAGTSTCSDEAPVTF